MSAIDAWRYRIFTIFARERASDELREEMRLHLEREAEDLCSRGIPWEEARRIARARFGDAAHWRDTVHDGWDWPWLDALRRTMQSAWRNMRRTPLNAMATVSMLATGFTALLTTHVIARAVERASPANSAHDNGAPMVALIMLAASLMLLLVAAANAAGLTLGRTVARRNELTLRSALGASPARLAGMIVAECVLASMVAVIPALGLTATLLAWARSAVPAALSDYAPELRVLGLDIATTGAGVGVAIVTGLLVAAPAMRFAAEQRVGAQPEHRTRALRPLRLLLSLQAMLAALLYSLTWFFARSAGARAAIPLRSDETSLVGHFVVPLLLTVVAATALGMAIVGVGAAVWHDVVRQVEAVAVRRALGGTVMRLAWGVVSPNLAPVAIGAVAGPMLLHSLGSTLAQIAYGVPAVSSGTAVGVAVIALVTMASGALVAARGVRGVNVATMLRRT